jgi:DNA-binding beta-propeller fold protein YncE/peroxiredoxin
MGLKAMAVLMCLAGLLGCNRYGMAMHEEGMELGPVHAPDFDGASKWLNTDNARPISIKDLKGQVILLDFWTYSCINCIHIFPDLRYLELKYHDQPVVVIGIHSGKFDQEKDPQHIREAVLRYNITHPVAVDSDFKIWNAYGVRAWPTQILIGPDGYIVEEWTGEGHRDAIDKKIGQLLTEGRAKDTLAKPIQFHPERESFKSGVLEFPGKILADAPGSRLFISDTNHNRIVVTDLAGKITQIIGDGVTGLKDGSFKDTEFRQPQGLALSADGKTLYIADTENHCIREADLVKGNVTTIAGDGTQGHRLSSVVPAKESSLSSPWDLALVGSKLYIAMAGVHQIWALDLQAMSLSPFAGTGREGSLDAQNKIAQFAQPSGLVTDGTHLYVADSESSSIRQVELAADGQTTTVAGSGDLFGFGHTDGPGLSALFQHPLGVALVGDRIFVADTLNSLVRAIDLKKDRVSTVLGTGKTDPGTADTPNLYEPGGLSVSGNTLYIADTNHHRILAMNLATMKARVLNVQMP